MLSHLAAKNEPLMVGQLAIALFISISVTSAIQTALNIFIRPIFNRSTKFFHNVYDLDRTVLCNRKMLSLELSDLSK